MKRFSNIQWYLAHANNTVHFIAASSHEISRSEFGCLLGKVLAAAPQLCQYESVAAQGHEPAEVSIEEISSVIESDQPVPVLDEVLAQLGPSFADTDKPTIRASLFTSPTPNQENYRSIVVIESTHAVMEGGDIADLLRGRTSDHGTRPVVNRQPSAGAMGIIRVIALPLALMHLFIAKLEKKDRQAFRHASIRLARADIKAAARRLGVSQQALLFALVLFATRPDPERTGRLRVGYSTLPAERSRIADDEYLNLRMQEVSFVADTNFTAFVKSVHTKIESTKDTPYFTMALYNHLIGVHRRLHAVAPIFYRGNFFGYSPTDWVLSMLPPLMPVRKFDMLKRSTIFAGSNTGTARNCIFCMGPDWVTLNFWADGQTLTRLTQLESLANEIFPGTFSEPS